MFRKKPILKYESALEVYPNIVTPAKNHIPEWYKKIPKWKDGEMHDLEKGFNWTVKQCIPFLESLTIGYAITLPSDIYVSEHNNEPVLSWPGKNYSIGVRDGVADINLVPFGHYEKEFTWKSHSAIKIPNNYSMLITHPLNRHDLPFTTLSGVVDGGFTMTSFGNIPFYIKKGFTGIIKQGTPIVQIIPFYPEDWISKVEKDLTKEGVRNDVSVSLVISGWYKKIFWKRKKYD